jgi:hypothetical protein
VNPREAVLIVMEALAKSDIRFEAILPCELEECRENLGRRYKTPMGIRCESCLGKVLSAALENGGRFWNCRCNTNAAPCPAPKKRWGNRDERCGGSPCGHLPECHAPRNRAGIPVTEWFDRQRAAA